MVVQDDQSITKSTYIICWSGAQKIYIYIYIFHILSMGLSNFPSYFSLLPLVLSNCPTYFIMFLLVSSNCSAYFSMFLCFFTIFFQNYFINFSIDFRHFFACFFGTISKGGLYSKMHFWGLIWPASLLWIIYIQNFVTLTVLGVFSIIFPERAIQDYNLYQYTTSSAYICRSGAPPCGMLPVPKPPIWLLAFFDHHKNWVWKD